MKRFVRWLAVGILTVPLLGCGSLHLYKKDADVAATSAKEDYDASKVADAIKAERAMLDALEAREIEAFRKVTLAQRNLELLSLVNESGTSRARTTDNGLVARFNRTADKRLIDLAGNGNDPLELSKRLDNSTRGLRDAELQERMARSQLVLLNTKFAAMPACNTAVAALKENATVAGAVALTQDASFKTPNMPVDSITTLGKACAVLLEARSEMDKALAQAKAGQLGRAIDDADKQTDMLKDAQQKAKAAGAALRKAAEELATAQKAVKNATAEVDLSCDLSKAAPSAGTVAKPAAAAASAPDAAKQPKADGDKNPVCDALAKLNELGDFGIKVISEERLAKINTVLQALSGFTPSTDEAPLEPSLALLSASSRFAQALQQYQQAGTLPALEPLLIEKQLAAAQLAYAQAGQQLSQARVSYAQEYAAATILEVDLLLRGKAELGSLGSPPATGSACTAKTAVFCASMRQLLEDKAMAQTANGAGESASRRAYRAMAFLSESYSVARDRQQTAELQLIDADYRDAMLRSEASVAGWNALISVPIDQLKAYHAGGVTPQELAQLLQALGVIGVAVRVK